MLMMFVGVFFSRFETDVYTFSWDARSSLDPKLKVQAHDAEVMAVAFSPAVDHLLLTGSSDKVWIRRASKGSLLKP